MSAWKPGQVGTIDTRPVGDRLVFFTGSAWVSAQGASLNRFLEPRPLVVIDPEDREQVERLAEAWSGACRVTPLRAPADRMQTALRSLVTPPKPDEPMGRYAAVQTAEGLEYVRLGDGPKPWMHNGSPSNRDTYAWSDITA